VAMQAPIRLRSPAEEVAVLLVDVDGVAVAVGHVAQSMLVDGDVGRQHERYGRRRSKLADTNACPYVVLRHAPRRLPFSHQIGFQFLPRDDMQMRPMPAVMRCLSVCASVTFVHYVETNKPIFKNFSPSGSHTILVFFHTKHHGNIPTRAPPP